VEVSDEPQWYVQKGARVLGPFSAEEVGRFLLLGRVRNTDRVSRDGELWEPVTQVPELVPEELLDLDGTPGWARFLTARNEQDERQVQVAVLEERRTEEDMSGRLREEWRKGSDDETPGNNTLPWSLFGVTLLALGVVIWMNIAAGI